MCNVYAILLLDDVCCCDDNPGMDDGSGSDESFAFILPHRHQPGKLTGGQEASLWNARQISQIIPEF